MPASELLELARSGAYDEFESRCLELLERGTLKLAQLVTPFERLEQTGQAERLATLTQMAIDLVGSASDSPAALALARLALQAAPANEELRRLTLDLYRAVHGGNPRFTVVLQASGLAGGRPVRTALKLLDLGLTLQPGDPLISRMDGHVAEVTDIDVEHALFTLRREGRTTTRPAAEVAREYDRVAPDDFRVLRQLRPERLNALIEEDPVALVVGLIQAHGGHIDADQLKHELVPRLISTGDWSRWWTRARTALKRSPHVLIEGRAPVLLSYQAEASTLEDETWDTLGAQKDPVDWLATVEGYLREKAERGETPDAPLLARIHEHLVKYIAAVRTRRPAEALTVALVLEQLAERGLPASDDTRGLAGALLREAPDPGALLTTLEHAGLRDRALAALEQARPDDWAQYALAWLPTAPAALLDKIAPRALAAGRSDALQAFIDAGLSDLPGHPELVFWLWKGPKQAEGLRLPPDAELFRLILDTLSTLGRTVAADPAVVKEFRHRMKAALALKNYEKAQRCISQLSEAAAVTVQRQLLRLEGLGENTPARLRDLLREAHPQLWAVRPTAVESWADPETLWTTAAGLARRTAERDELVNVKMRDNARKIGEAAAHGDLSENSEYKFALEERDLLRARVAKINEELSQARVLEPHDVPDDHVGIGSRVRLRALDDGTERVLTFLGPFDTDTEQGIYSYQAPLSQQLMGKRVGERVRLTIDGIEREFELAEIGSAVTRPRPA